MLSFAKWGSQRLGGIMLLGYRILVLLLFLSLSNLARSDNMNAYFDSKTWEELTEFGNGLIGRNYDKNICLPNTINCKNKRFSHYPWKESQPIERVYYIIYGERNFESYHDSFSLIVETDEKNIVINTKLTFGYDSRNFSTRGILPHFSNFTDMKIFFSILQDYIKSNDLNFDQAKILIDGSGLQFIPELSSETQRVYINVKYPESNSFESSSIEARAGFNLNPNWPDYLKISWRNDSFPILEFSKNGSFWVNDPTVK